MIFFFILILFFYTLTNMTIPLILLVYEKSISRLCSPKALLLSKKWLPNFTIWKSFGFYNLEVKIDFRITHFQSHFFSIKKLPNCSREKSYFTFRLCTWEAFLTSRLHILKVIFTWKKSFHVSQFGSHFCIKNVVNYTFRMSWLRIRRTSIKMQ